MAKISVKTLKESLTRPDGQGNWVLRAFWLWLITGAAYYLIEGVWHICSNGGWANITMMPIGGLGGVLVGVMNENPKFMKKKMILQSLYGMASLVVVEFIAGFVLNVVLKLNVWNYSNIPMNFMGQICLPFAALWFLFTPFIVWFDDYIRLKIWSQGERYPWYKNYIKLFTLK
ncbi:MAG: putative ABC transporter permease [Clostridiales bacterium]|jgi:hypothetical protein|nr:putative ABC transporter permease [Clostridiales bacterium]